MTKPLDLQIPYVTLPDVAVPFMEWIHYEQLTCRQAAILVVVRANPGISTGAVASVLSLNKPSITRAIDKMEKINLVTRSPDPKDRRLVCLYARKQKKIKLKAG